MIVTDKIKIWRDNRRPSNRQYGTRANKGLRVERQAPATPLPPRGLERLADLDPPAEDNVWHPVPEWATWLMLGAGLAVVAALLAAIVYLLG
ncbi:hypothetical protein ACFOKI_11880 [Sphingomonas qilianensis]|uniref:Uncharacterized protein n=1 Tax=Sphingomonas qilianensis TaxID=1736690 RepID=A0ABU9XP04_9SPHN